MTNVSNEAVTTFETFEETATACETSEIVVDTSTEAVVAITDDAEHTCGIRAYGEEGLSINCTDFGTDHGSFTGNITIEGVDDSDGQLLRTSGTFTNDDATSCPIAISMTVPNDEGDGDSDTVTLLPVESDNEAPYPELNVTYENGHVILDDEADHMLAEADLEDGYGSLDGDGNLTCEEITVTANEDGVIQICGSGCTDVSDRDDVFNLDYGDGSVTSCGFSEEDS